MKKRNYPNPDMFDLKDNVASSTECTGLIQSMPITEDEVEEYADICEIPNNNVKSGD